MRNDAMIRRTERWFIRQGVPHLIDGYRFRTHVLPRMLPFLALVIAVSISVPLLLVHTVPGVGALVGVSVLLLGLVGLSLLLARGQLPRANTIILIAYALAPLVVPLLLLGTYGQSGRALVIGGPGSSATWDAVATGLVLVASFAAIFVVAWLVTEYGLVPLAVRAIGHAMSDMRGSFQLQGRALPTLLFVTFFLFFTSELWQLMNHLSWGRLVLVLVLFAAVTILATATRLRAEINRVEQDLNPDRLSAACTGTPLGGAVPASVSTPAPLNARQETNVLLVLATRQLIQAAVVGLGLFVFFVVLGLIIVDESTATSWIMMEPRHSAWIPFMPVALFRAAALLAGFGSMYFAITTMTQVEYRREFFEPVISDVERTLAVRAVYLDLRRN